ncbi:MAG: alpha/beta hydrolase [Solirubrobacteraceae bacterium]|jgi:pimeloyl-ACP methyl ester carboxylesterase
MLRVVKGAALATAAGLATLLVGAATASAAVSPVAFVPCANAPGFGCAHLTVPLDPSGVVPGTVTLSIERKVAVTGTATQAIVGLAGGPGQAAIPFASDFAQTLSSALGTRDLIVFDQRGTGTSGALSCPAFGDPDAMLTPALVGTCGQQLGVARGFYESDDTVADIEAIREALGYSQLILYGTSYGTKVALRYAEQYPSDVAGLILDSTVQPNGPDVYSASTFAAIPGMLADLCAHNACAGISGSPMADLTTLVTRLDTQPVDATVIGPRGQVDRVRIGPDDVFNILISGDLDPLLRADLPAALHAAATKQDYALLGALDVIANAPEGGISDELYFATSCEENSYPWSRADSTTQRTAEAVAAFDAQPPTTFAPFTAKTAYDESDAPYCADWPFETASPEPTSGTLPNVPTLIISGAEDMRTPTADARAVAAEIPDATLLVVPNTGHSVLGTEPTNCAQDAVDAFLSSKPIEQCTNSAIPTTLRPAPLPPESVARLRAARGTSGLAGKTLTAVLETLSQALDTGVDDFLDGSSLSATVHFGGLRAGWASFSLRGLRLHSYSYVPGVSVSGGFDTHGSSYTLVVSGAHAATGTVVFDTKTKRISGTLGGSYVSTSTKRLAAQEASTARASAADAAGYSYARALNS